MARIRSWAARDQAAPIAAHIILRAPTGRILLLLRAGQDHHGQWGLPGGGIEDGESPLQALMREVNEEIGEDLGVIDGAEEAIKYLGAHTNSHSHLLDIGEEFSPIISDDEHSGYAWAMPDALPEGIHPNAVTAINEATASNPLTKDE